MKNIDIICAVPVCASTQFQNIIISSKGRLPMLRVKKDKHVEE